LLLKVPDFIHRSFQPVGSILTITILIPVVTLPDWQLCPPL